jgi:hypothetical protein
LAVADVKYLPGYLADYAGLALEQIRQLASRDETAQQDVASLTFEEFNIVAAHFPILGLGTTLLLEAMDPERAMAMRRFGDRSGIGKTLKYLSCLSCQHIAAKLNRFDATGTSGILARETSQLSAMMLSVVRCERQRVSGELTEHTEYMVRVESAETSFTCRRRYSHFLALHQKVA